MLLTAKDAIARHIQWKITFQMAIRLEEQLTAEQLEQIRNHRLCLIGRWLGSPATECFRHHPDYHALVIKHITFHHAMEAVANLIADRRFDQAAAATSSQSDFIAAGDALAYAITSFHHVLAISLPAQHA